MTSTSILRRPAVQIALAILLAGPASCSRPQAGNPPSPVALAYRSIDDSFVSWTKYAPDGPGSGSIEFGEDERPPVLRLAAVATSKIGANKMLPARRGRVEFEYSAGPGTAGNLFLFAIPMYNSEKTRVRLLEFGAATADDPRSGFSPARRRFAVPAAHRGDGQWHPAALEFDFSALAGVIAVAIAPRVNEGSTEAGPGTLSLRNVQVYSDAARQAGGP